MKKLYEKPMILENDDFSEGVYMTGSGSSCYTASGKITQSPTTGMDYYVIQMDGYHKATDGHGSSAQTVTVSFNQPVTYVSSTGTLVSTGTSSIVLSYAYTQNATDYIGLGNLSVKSNSGLQITGVSIFDGH